MSNNEWTYVILFENNSTRIYENNIKPVFQHNTFIKWFWIQWDPDRHVADPKFNNQFPGLINFRNLFIIVVAI